MNVKHLKPRRDAWLCFICKKIVSGGSRCILCWILEKNIRWHVSSLRLDPTRPETANKLCSEYETFWSISRRDL